MKKLNLNIKLNEPVKADDGKRDMEGHEVATRWIGSMIERAINKVDMKTMRPTVGVKMEVQRRYFKVMDALESAKDGIAELVDEDFHFMDTKFHQAEAPVQLEVSKVLVQIDDAINKAKVEEKKEVK